MRTGGKLTKKRRRLSAPPPELTRTKSDLAQVVRHVVERRVQLVADALHRANRRNGDQSSDETVFDRGRTLRIANQFDELAHGLCSLVPSTGAECAPTCSP